MKLPPYGKYLFKLQLLHELPINDVYVFMGINAWKKAEAFQHSRPSTMCLPPGQDPEQYDWPVNNCDILLFDTSQSDAKLIQETASCLLSRGARIVRYISNDNFLTIFNKDA